jgi:hypothetical protein
VCQGHLSDVSPDCFDLPGSLMNPYRMAYGLRLEDTVGFGFDIGLHLQPR